MVEQLPFKQLVAGSSPAGPTHFDFKAMNKFNLIISSSGFNDINNEISDEIVELFKKISKNKKVLIIANAAPKGTGNYIARDNVKQNFLKIGASKVDVIDINENNTNIIPTYDIIYGLGGNPTLLIELNQKTNLKKYLIEFLKHGIYIGESAGTMILSDHLEWVYIIKKGTKEKYNVILDSYEGLNLSKHKVFPHLNKTEEEIKNRINDYENKYKVKIDRLDDGEFILEYYQ